MAISSASVEAIACARLVRSRARPTRSIPLFGQNPAERQGSGQIYVLFGQNFERRGCSGQIARPRRARSGCRSRLANELGVEHELDVVGERDARHRRSRGRIPHHAEVLAVDLAGRRGADAAVAAYVLGLVENGPGGQHDRAVVPRMVRSPVTLRSPPSWISTLREAKVTAGSARRGKITHRLALPPRWR